MKHYLQNRRTVCGHPRPPKPITTISIHSRSFWKCSIKPTSVRPSLAHRLCTLNTDIDTCSLRSCRWMDYDGNWWDHLTAARRNKVRETSRTIWRLGPAELVCIAAGCSPGTNWGNSLRDGTINNLKSKTGTGTFSATVDFSAERTWLHPPLICMQRASCSMQRNMRYVHKSITI